MYFQWLKRCRPIFHWKLSSSFHASYSGFQSGMSLKVSNALSIISQWLLCLANTTTCGSTKFGSSSVPTEKVTSPTISGFFAYIGLPQRVQKKWVVVFPRSETWLNSDNVPLVVKFSSGNITPVVWPAPLLFWQTMQRQCATIIGSPLASYLTSPQKQLP